jgi:hypothetical protein
VKKNNEMFIIIFVDIVIIVLYKVIFVFPKD